MHKKIKRFADIQVLPELDAVAVQVSERVRRYFGEAESYDDFQPGTDVGRVFDVRNIQSGGVSLQDGATHWKPLRQMGPLVRRLEVGHLLCGGIFTGHSPQMAGKGRHMRRKQKSLCGNLSHNCAVWCIR